MTARRGHPSPGGYAVPCRFPAAAALVDRENRYTRRFLTDRHIRFDPKTLDMWRVASVDHDGRAAATAFSRYLCQGGPAFADRTGYLVFLTVARPET